MSGAQADNQTSVTDDAVNQPGTSLVSVEIASTWSDAQEKLLKAIAERSNCMRWLHTQCNLHFENFNFYLTIPNIIISTVNGSITMSISSLFPDSQREATTIVGLISLLSAILLTINQYVKSQQMAESHHTAGLAYGKIYRSVMNELTLRRDQRENGLDFLHHIRAEIDRLESTAPSILPYIIRSFNKQFANRTIEKPEIAGDLDEVEINSGAEPSGSQKQLTKGPFVDTTDDDELPSGRPGRGPGGRPSRSPNRETKSGSGSGSATTKSSVASTLSSLFTAATSVLYPSLATATAATAAATTTAVPAAAPALQEYYAVDPKHLPKHLQLEEEKEDEVTKTTNVIVDMGVTTETDMGYTIPQQQQEQQPQEQEQQTQSDSTNSSSSS